LLKKELEEWKRKAQDSETKYEVSQKKLMQVFTELKEVQDQLNEEKKKTEEIEKRAAEEGNKAVEDVKQLGEVIKQKDEEIQKLKEEGAKNKNGGELFKMAQDISQLGEKLALSEQNYAELAIKLSSTKIELEVEMKLRKQLDEKNRQLRSELNRLRLQLGTPLERKLSFAESEKALRQLDVVKRSFSSLQEVLRVVEKSIGHTSTQVDTFKMIVDQERSTVNSDEAGNDQQELEATEQREDTSRQNTGPKPTESISKDHQSCSNSEQATNEAGKNNPGEEEVAHVIQ